MKNQSNFVISLDFELNWGVWDVVKLENYKSNLIGVQKVIPELLDLFSKYNIEATFATVGFLFFDNKADLISNLPLKKPSYSDKDLSPFINQIKNVGSNEDVDKFHFAKSLVKLVKSYNQEIASHTFSHFYCLEKGQSKAEFEADLQAFQKISSKEDIELKSIVFPRNQYNKDYIVACKEAGIICYRGNEKAWIYKAKELNKDTLFIRLLRLLDSYINISGYNCYSNKFMKNDLIINIPSSRFLRPFSKKLAIFEKLRLARIKKSMTYAAKNNLTFHLWWHPHNFGTNLSENLQFLESILNHKEDLKRLYNFRSISMQNLAKELILENE